MLYRKNETSTKRNARLLWCGVAVVLAVAFLAAACGGSSDSSDDSATAATDDPTAASQPDDVSTVSDESAAENLIFVYNGADVLGGETVALSEVLQQGLPVVLNFWAGLCPPCRQEMPDFQEISEERAGEVLILGIDVGRFTNLGSQQDALDLLAELGISYPTGYVDSDALLREYSIFEMPSTVFFTADGEVLSKDGGFLTGGQIRDRVAEIIDAPG